MRWCVRKTAVNCKSTNNRNYNNAMAKNGAADDMYRIKRM